MKKRSKPKRLKAEIQQEFAGHPDGIPTAGKARKRQTHEVQGHGPLRNAEMLRMLEEHAESRLPQAKAQWFFGEWTALAAMDMQALRSDPERDRFALLAASAHEQLGAHNEARKCARLALQWGCSARLVAQVLIAGVHNTLGRSAALARNDVRAARHFREAVAIAGNPRDAELLSHARSVREMAKLGLLPEAASLVDRELARTRQLSERPEQTRARIRVLETELELLRGELSLAQQRQQLRKWQPAMEPKPASPDAPDWLAELRKKSVSQLGQDLWVLEQTGYKRGGFFVELGATDGVLLSNTCLLEKEFGWQGICAEPNPKFFDKLKNNRKCVVSSACISGTTGKEVYFILADAYSSMESYADRDMHADKRAAYAKIGSKIKLTTISLNDFLNQYNAPREIDYLSIDTEGSELEILAAFPFSEWKIDLLTVEHNFTPQREHIRALLLGHGYTCVEREWDDWYVRSETS